MTDSNDVRLFRPCCETLLPMEIVHTNPWFKVVNRGGYFTTEYTEAESVVLPVVDNNAIVMVKVKRPVIDDETWELPAGGIDLACESAADGAARELREETGINITDSVRLKPLPPLAVSPNRNPRLTFVFQVDIQQEEFDARGDHDEEICEVRCFPLEEIRAMITDGSIYVTMPVAMIGRYLMQRWPK